MRRWESVGLAAGLLAAAAVAWAARNYARWRSLGPGGLPANLKGWAAMTRYRLIAQDELDPAPIALKVGCANDLRGWTMLRGRPGSRPGVSPYPIPHRQVSQLAPPDMRVRLAELFERTAGQLGDHVHFALSHFERRHSAITLKSAAGKVGSRSFGEIAHIHPSDSSMHMILSPTDAVAAIERGWAQRHGLAGVAAGLPLTYVMIYSPRDEDDLKVVGELLEAAVAYAIQPVAEDEV